MEITKHDMDMMKGLTKEVADHIRDINTIIEARQAAGWMHVHELEKYKEAITDLFIKECGLILKSQKTFSGVQPS